jgi:hypothetical protein
MLSPTTTRYPRRMDDEIITANTTAHANTYDPSAHDHYVALSDHARMSRFAFVLEPFFYKGVATMLELCAVCCACQGVCVASSFHWKFLCCGERGIMTSLLGCSTISAVATLLALGITAKTLIRKWGSDDITSSLLVMSFYAFVATILFCLRTSTALKSHKALEALNDEVITV